MLSAGRAARQIRANWPEQCWQGLPNIGPISSEDCINYLRSHISIQASLHYSTVGLSHDDRCLPKFRHEVTNTASIRSIEQWINNPQHSIAADLDVAMRTLNFRTTCWSFFHATASWCILGRISKTSSKLKLPQPKYQQYRNNSSQ